MKLLRQLGLRAKLFLMMTFAMVTALLLSCAVFVIYDQHTQRRLTLGFVEHETTFLGDYSAPSLDFDDRDSLNRILNSFAKDRHIMAAAIHKPDGTVFTSYVRPDVSSNFELESIPDEPSFIRDNRVEAFAPIQIDGKTLGHARIIRDLEDVRERTNRILGIAAAVLAGSFLLAVLVSIAVRRTVADPVIRLSQLARSVAETEDFSPRAQRESEDEIGQLVEDFNSMLDKLQARDKSLLKAKRELETRVQERTEELRLSQEKLMLHLEATPLGVIDRDADGRIVSWNPAAEQAFGWTADAARGRRFSDFMMSATEEQDTLNRKQLVTECYTKAGATQICEWFNTPLVDREGCRIGTASLVQDVTERVRAETAMRESEQRFSTVFRTSPIALVIVEIATDRIVDANESFAKLIAANGEKLLTSKLGDNEFWQSREVSTQLLAEASRENSGYRVECEIQTGEGETRQVQISAECIRLGYRECLMLQMTDETDRIAAEKEREHIQVQLVEASRQVGKAEVASDVLHNVGNVLNGVNVSANLVIDRLRKIETPTLSRAAGVIREQAANLPEFFATDPRGGKFPDLLDHLAHHFASEREYLLTEIDGLGKKIEHIKEIVSMQQSLAKTGGVTQVFDPAELFHDALQLAGDAIVRHGIELKQNLQPVGSIRADRHRILQILINFLRNAKHACDDGENPEKRITIGLEQSDGHVIFSVADSGIGIPAENLLKIFNHGFTTKASGHGFGLHGGALAARQMGGEIHVTSDGPGRGARFTLELPIAESDAASGPQDHSQN